MLPMLMRALFGEDLTALRTAIGVAGRAHGEVLSRRMPAWRTPLIERSAWTNSITLRSNAWIARRGAITCFACSMPGS